MERDWNELWKIAQQQASFRKRQQGNNGVQCWNRRAAWYNKMEHNGSKRVALLKKHLKLNRKTTVLDIGCGPGVLAIPLAKVVSSVTALDPSDGMLTELESNARNERLANVVTINKKWEDVKPGIDVGNHDVVIASYSLVMDDIRAAMEKMNSVAKEAVCLFWFAGEHKMGNETLWPRLFGEPFVSGPDHIYLLNILHQMGIYANVIVSDQKSRLVYSSLEEAVNQYRDNFRVVAERDIDIIREHLAEILVADNGGFSITRTMNSAMIWWQKPGTA